MSYLLAVLFPLTEKCVPKIRPDFLDNGKKLQHQLLQSINISVQDVTDVFENLDISKACGPDLISPRLLKEGSSILARPFSFIFNSSLEQGTFPTPWKDSTITPIHKKDDRLMLSNFRPVSLLSQSWKVMERCIHKHFYNYIVLPIRF